jgi:SAM-dependent methyltransferase
MDEMTPEYQMGNSLTIKQVAEFVQQFGTKDIADIGGAGMESRLTLFDIKADVYDLNKEEFEGEGIVHDICKNPLPKQYDTILCCNTYEHIIDPYKASQNIIKSLKPGGYVFITTVWIYPFHAYRDVIDTYRYTDQALSVLFKELEEVKCWYENEFHPEGTIRVSYIGRKK